MPPRAPGSPPAWPTVLALGTGLRTWCGVVRRDLADGGSVCEDLALGKPFTASAAIPVLGRKKEGGEAPGPWRGRRGVEQCFSGVWEKNP